MPVVNLHKVVCLVSLSVVELKFNFALQAGFDITGFLLLSAEFNAKEMKRLAKVQPVKLQLVFCLQVRAREIGRNLATLVKYM